MDSAATVMLQTWAKEGKFLLSSLFCPFEKVGDQYPPGPNAVGNRATINLLLGTERGCGNRIKQTETIGVKDLYWLQWYQSQEASFLLVTSVYLAMAIQHLHGWFRSYGWNQLASLVTMGRGGPDGKPASGLPEIGRL